MYGSLKYNVFWVTQFYLQFHRNLKKNELFNLNHKYGFMGNGWYIGSQEHLKPFKSPLLILLLCILDEELCLCPMEFRAFVFRNGFRVVHSWPIGHSFFLA